MMIVPVQVQLLGRVGDMEARTATVSKALAQAKEKIQVSIFHLVMAVLM